MVNIAPNLEAVRERAVRFFSPNSVRSVEIHREIIEKLSDVGEVVVVGGLIRDLAFFGADERPTSDIDFVVTGHAVKLDRLAQRLGATPNRFGGFGVKRDGYKVDFWALNKTWAKKERYARVNSPKDLVRTTFFDWDAIVYDINNKKIYAIDGYISRLNRRILDVNLMENPSIHGNVVRASRRLVMWDARPGRKLKIFLENNLKYDNWSEIVASERGAFHTCYLDQFNTTLEFKRKVIGRLEGYTAGIDERRQLYLPF